MVLPPLLVVVYCTSTPRVCHVVYMQLGNLSYALYRPLYGIGNSKNVTVSRV